jgi:hypothetical protein
MDPTERSGWESRCKSVTPEKGVACGERLGMKKAERRVGVVLGKTRQANACAHTRCEKRQARRQSLYQFKARQTTRQGKEKVETRPRQDRDKTEPSCGSIRE